MTNFHSSLAASPLHTSSNSPRCLPTRAGVRERDGGSTYSTGAKVKQSETCAVHKKAQLIASLHGKQGLHTSLGTEGVRMWPQQSGEAFSWSDGANGSRGSCSSSFVLRGVSYRTDGFISTEGLYRTSHLWAQTRGQCTTSNYQRLAIFQGAAAVDEGKMVDEVELITGFHRPSLTPCIRICR